MDTNPWICVLCGRKQRWFDVRLVIWLVDSPDEMKTVCAACHKQMTRERRIKKEAL